MYQRLDVYSAYEYLENRFNVAVRCLAAVIFILWRLGWMATALYAPCIAFHTATGRAASLEINDSDSLCAVATIYTMMGGIKAVIWTEVIQFIVMFGGLLLTSTIIFRTVSTWPVHHAAARGRPTAPRAGRCSARARPAVSSRAATPSGRARLLLELLVVDPQSSCSTCSLLGLPLRRAEQFLELVRSRADHTTTPSPSDTRATGAVFRRCT